MASDTSSKMPSSFLEWRDCITVKCRIALTLEYVESRLRELRDSGHPKTREFTALYGDNYTQQVITWFEQASREGLS